MKDRYKEVFESKETKKNATGINEKKKKMEKIAEECFNSKYSVKQLEKLYANCRANAIAKSNFNSSQRSQTGGGVPKLKDLKDFETKIIEMVTVSERISNVLDSEHVGSQQNTVLNVTETSQKQMPAKRIKPEFTSPRTNGSQYPQSFVDTQIFHTNMSRIESSHLNSIKCLAELYKMPENAHVMEAIKCHETNLNNTKKILFPNGMNFSTTFASPKAAEYDSIGDFDECMS